MMSGRFGASRGDVVRLFEGSSIAGLNDGELLGRFADRRDEVAFEALVGRLGPMVLGVCRRILSDSHDVDDAFQATFLVLVRRAGSIRERDMVGPWLYGVASKVARRARADAARRSARDRLKVVDEAGEDSNPADLEWSEVRARIDEEIGRLPEHHRRAVVLCDVEGLSREEAAERLGWTLNMVRGRLDRARERLRTRLSRRGLAPSGAGMILGAARPIPSPSLVAATTRAALAFAGGGVVGTGLATASAVALSRGVLRMMMLSKLKLVVPLVLSASLVAGGTGWIAAGQEPVKPATKPAEANPSAGVPKRSLAELAKRRISSASQRFEAQNAFYEEGRITIDRLADASKQWMQAESDASDSKAGRVAAGQAHYDRIAKILKRERAELEIGRATVADVAEIESVLTDAEFALAKEMEATEAKADPALPRLDGPGLPAARPKAGDSPALAKIAADRVEVARRVFMTAGKLFPSEIDMEEYANAAIMLMEAERAAARSQKERVDALRSMVQTIQKIVTVKAGQVRDGTAKVADVDRAKLRLLDAEFALAQEMEAPDAKSVALGAAAGTTRLDSRFAPVDDPASPKDKPRTVESPALAKIAADRVEVARRLATYSMELYQNARIEATDVCNAQTLLMEAERDAAVTKEGREAAFQRWIDQLRNAQAIAEARVEQGRGTQIGVDLARLDILHAQYLQAKEKESTGPGDDIERRLADVERKLDRLLNLLDGGANRKEKR